MPNFSSSGFANASSYSKFVKLLQDISMTSQFHRKFFAVLVWQIIWSQSCNCLFWESFSPLCNIFPNFKTKLKFPFQFISANGWPLDVHAFGKNYLEILSKSSNLTVILRSSWQTFQSIEINPLFDWHKFSRYKFRHSWQKTRLL